jgi:hypothetical protein
MTKALAHPSRKALYSRNIIEATSQYDIGLIEDCLRAATCPTRLKRLTLLAEVSAIYAEEKHISAIFKSLRLYRDDLSGVNSPMPFQVDFRLTVVDFGAKSLNIRPSGAPVHGERAEYPAQMVSVLLLRADTYQPIQTEIYIFHNQDQVWRQRNADLLRTVVDAVQHNFGKEIRSDYQWILRQ